MFEPAHKLNQDGVKEFEVGSFHAANDRFQKAIDALTKNHTGPRFPVRILEHICWYRAMTIGLWISTVEERSCCDTRRPHELPPQGPSPALLCIRAPGAVQPALDDVNAALESNSDLPQLRDKAIEMRTRLMVTQANAVSLDLRSESGTAFNRIRHASKLTCTWLGLTGFTTPGS